MSRPIALTLPLNHQKIDEISSKIGSEHPALEVSMHEEPGPYRLCFWNADYMVERYGGQIQLGWNLLYWPGVVIHAQYHAVWKSPSGEFLDVTVKGPSDDTPHFSVFVCDDRGSFSADTAPNMESIYLPLTSDPRVVRWLAVEHEFHLCEEAAADFAREIGFKTGLSSAAMARNLPPPTQDISPENGKRLMELRIIPERVLSIQITELLGDIYRKPPNPPARKAVEKIRGNKSLLVALELIAP